MWLSIYFETGVKEKSVRPPSGRGTRLRVKSSSSNFSHEQRLLLQPCCPGFSWDRVNFHKKPGGDAAGPADPNWPNKPGIRYRVPSCLVRSEGAAWGEVNRSLGVCWAFSLLKHTSICWFLQDFVFNNIRQAAETKRVPYAWCPCRRWLPAASERNKFTSCAVTLPSNCSQKSGPLVATTERCCYYHKCCLSKTSNI